LQIDIHGLFLALNFYIVTYVKFYRLFYGQVLRVGKNGGRPGRTYTAILNKKGHFRRAKFLRKNFFFKKFPSKFYVSHPFAYPNIIAGLKVDFTDLTHIPLLPCTKDLGRQKHGGVRKQRGFQKRLSRFGS
jgi:hypothetical protein